MAISVSINVTPWVQSLSQSSLKLCWHRAAMRCNVSHPSAELKGVYFWIWSISVSAFYSLTCHIQWHSINTSVKWMSHNFRICSWLWAAQSYLSLVTALSNFRAQYISVIDLAQNPAVKGTHWNFPSISVWLFSELEKQKEKFSKCRGEVRPRNVQFHDKVSWLQKPQSKCTCGSCICYL